MTDHEPGYHYSVIREAEPGQAYVALVRSPEPHGALGHLLHKQSDDVVVLMHRTFRPMLELTEMEAYTAQLERAATHANAGTFGCFVVTEQREDGIVRLALYERWFDGQHLRCEELAGRDFDATEPNVVASSAEFLTELQAWAAERNEQREAGYREAAVNDRDQLERATERVEAARELAQILERHNTPADAR
ncbi:MAG: hypothetical protein FWD04_08060 [Conexibacteraceae bacterium]|nr:hypothetical protein [Conexibacteraceae bacterium]